MTAKTLASVFFDYAGQSGDNPFIRDGRDRCYSYAQAKTKIKELAAHYQSLGVKRWDRVIILSPNHILIPLSLYAINALGATTVIINDQTIAATVKVIADEVEPALILCHENWYDGCKSLADCPVINLDDLFSVDITNTTPVTQPVGCSADPALMIYTSGSTGKPKGVVLSNDNIIFVTEKIQARLSYNASDVVGLFLPLSFDYGLYQVFLTLISGACLFLSDASSAGPALAMTLQNNKITVFPGVPHLYGILTQFLNRRKMNLSEIRLCTNTGAHLAATQIEHLHQFLPGAHIMPMYGLTECKRVSILGADELDRKPGSCGRALDDTETFIVDDDGKILPPDEVGELVIIGRHLAMGYWKSPEETALRYRTHPCGIGRALYSGDNFRMDAEGYLYYIGRRDEQIKRHGFRINRLEIENVALTIPGIQNTCLLQHNNKLILFVEFGDFQVSTVEIMNFLAKNLEAYKVPDSIEVMEKLPVSNNGKINRKAIEASLS